MPSAECGIETSRALLRNKANRLETGGNPPHDEACQTKPNLGGTGYLGKNERCQRGGVADERSVRNKANCRGMNSGRPVMERVKQSQSDSEGHEVLCWKEVMLTWRMLRNKANAG